MALPSWWSKVKGIMDARGVPVRVWLPILWSESSGDPTARNTGTPGHPEDSVGLFAMNRLGGLGANYSVSQLQDPVINASLAANSFTSANVKCAAKGQAWDVTCIAVNSGHPWELGTIPPHNQLVANIQAAYAAIGSTADDATSWANVSKAKPGDPTTVTGPGQAPSWWEQVQNLIAGGHQGDPTRTPNDPTADLQDKAIWNVVFTLSGIGLVWIGLSGLVAPGVGAAANLAAPIVPQARAVGAAAGVVGGATRAVGSGAANIGRTAVRSIDAAVPKSGGRQAIRIKGRLGTVARPGIPQPPLKSS